MVDNGIIGEMDDGRYGDKVGVKWIVGGLKIDMIVVSVSATRVYENLITSQFC